MNDPITDAVARAIYEADFESGYDKEDEKTFWKNPDGYWPPEKKSFVWQCWEEIATAAITAFLQAAREQGWQLVPVEPTEEQIVILFGRYLGFLWDRGPGREADYGPLPIPFQG